MSVAVIIPTIPPHEHLLPEALASVHAQTRPPDELIVEPDPNGTGGSATRNRAIMRATSKWIAFLDDDDYLYPDHLETLLTYSSEHRGLDVIYPWYDGHCADTAHTYDGALVEGAPFSRIHRDHILLTSGTIIPITTLVRRAALEQVGGFPDEWPEMDRLWRRLLYADLQFGHVPRRTWYWRAHDTHTSGRPWTTNPTFALV